MELLNGGGWLKPSLFALFFWGIWGFLTKIGAEKVPWQTTMIYFGVCTIIIAFIGGPNLSLKTFDGYHLASLAAGVAVALGYLYFFIAISRGSASNVIPLTSLYVAVSSILAFLILAEPLTLKKMLGIICAIAAMFLLAG